MTCRRHICWSVLYSIIIGRSRRKCRRVACFITAQLRRALAVVKVTSQVSGFFPYTWRAQLACSEKQGKSTSVFFHYVFTQSSLTDWLFFYDTQKTWYFTEWLSKRLSLVFVGWARLLAGDGSHCLNGTSDYWGPPPETNCTIKMKFGTIDYVEEGTHNPHLVTFGLLGPSLYRWNKTFGISPNNFGFSVILFE